MQQDHERTSRTRLPSRASTLVPLLAWGVLAVGLLVVLFHWVDLRPRVDENFFFSSDDPVVRVDDTISRTFHQDPELVLSAPGDVRSPLYRARIAAFADTLAAIPGVESVQSLTRGPRSTGDALESPLWSRILFPGRHDASFVYVFVRRDAPLDSCVIAVEAIQHRFERLGVPLMMSGAPYIVELIQRNLVRDFQIFSLAALLVFGLSALLISRSIPMVLGTLITCTSACALTLILTRALRVPIGPLTANLSTIVFVLTLTHMVFMTFNWRHLLSTGEADGPNAWRRAVRVTLLPSAWSMLTALLGFVSLLFVPAEPLRQLGVAGIIGVPIAFGAAYLMYPFFLRVQTPPRDEAARAPAAGRRPPFLENRHGVLVAVFLAFAAIVSAGLWKLDTSPSLSSYFAAGSTLRTSLDYVDRHGGSVPLELVVANPNGAPLRVGDDYQRLWRLQHQLERDPSVGSVMSLTLLLAEGKRPWYASFVPTGWVLRTLEGPRFGRVARYFVTKSHTRALFALRMRDSYRAVEPLENVARLERMVRLEGFKPVQVGGIYVLYSRLSVLVGKSLFEGLMLLLLAFAIMGAIIARSLRVGAAVLVGLSAVPVTMLGVLGLLHVPVDMISAPGANIAIGIGVDALIHTLVWVRRYPAASMGSWEAWSAVCKRLWKPILYSTSIVCAGFAIFLLSGFPPTQRFGLMVLLGTLLAPLPAVLVVPWLATDRPPAYRAPWARRAYALGAK